MFEHVLLLSAQRASMVMGSIADGNVPSGCCYRAESYRLPFADRWFGVAIILATDDLDVNSEPFARELLRVIGPGGYVAVFAHPATQLEDTPQRLLRYGDAILGASPQTLSLALHGINGSAVNHDSTAIDIWTVEPTPALPSTDSSWTVFVVPSDPTIDSTPVEPHMRWRCLL